MKMRMKPWIMLRVASVITFLYFAGHMLGMPWTPAVGPQEVTLPSVRASGQSILIRHPRAMPTSG